MLDVEAIKARWAAATPGPWEAVCRDSLDDWTREDAFLGFEVDGPPEAYRGQFARGADALAIAAAPEDVAALVAEVARLREALVALTAQEPLAALGVRHEERCSYCWKTHTDDCPWLLASKGLVSAPSAPVAPAG